MFWHIVSYRLKCLVREKTLIFWTLLFPLVLGTLFHLAFANLNEADSLKAIDMAYVNETGENIQFKTTLDMVSKKGENQLFHKLNMTKKEANQALKDGEIEGYIENGVSLKLVVNRTGTNQTIMKSFLDTYQQKSSTITHILKTNPALLNQELFEATNIRKDTTSSNVDATVIYFYTLIGMFCAYASFWGNKTVMEFQANQSPKGARFSLSPVRKFSGLLAGLFAAFIVQTVEYFIILAYLIFVLGVDFGSNIGAVILIGLVGSIAGISMGSLVGASIKKDENAKVGILVCISMLMSFLAGMMVVDIKYIIATNAPLLGMINPVNLITDGLYGLYYYTTMTKFYENILLLCLFSVVCYIITYFLIRRQKYESL